MEAKTDPDRYLSPPERTNPAWRRRSSDPGMASESNMLSFYRLP